jgi:hypothetical protein
MQQLISKTVTAEQIVIAFGIIVGLGFAIRSYNFIVTIEHQHIINIRQNSPLAVVMPHTTITKLPKN